MEHGTILQYKGPFSVGSSFSLEKSTKFGISIDEKDYMKLDGQGKKLVFSINGQDIYLGETFMYQTDNAIASNSVIQFPEGAPASTLINIVYEEEE